MMLKMSVNKSTISNILKLKYTKFDFVWSSAPDPAGGAYRATQTR